ncbi:MAG TPA: tRNA (adenosine(37)-N6)-threonylcarbamoyltransferase complex dimerization subunit type 1 TsaB [Candidatus Aminicenantes bacterium]|nr:tRNA (adenosine(37)-N6)-threonylcarbamoyltransferase complex dimerization subunit type 1 TsaB [Candidatus Aminicenantes bacterium]HDT13533.1 tRNA (adenosine(37)-N6)-threonylcarbamoyltransferase complex dimerization subunit type 1 TsaB [Candidatus Aminicenantes bacterium]
MLVLAVDTTTPSGSVALLEDGTLLGEADVESAATHSARLFRSIDFLLAALGRDVRDIEAFAVAAGPGSFTGIRIGIAAVKSLAFASGRPIAPVSTLEALAAKLVAKGARLVCPLLDARKGEIYAGLFEARAGGLVEAVPQGAYDPGEFFARLPKRRVIAFAGSGLDACRGRLPGPVRARARFPNRSPFIAAEVGRIGTGLIGAGLGVEAASLAPLYFRRSQAEETCRT